VRLDAVQEAPREGRSCPEFALSLYRVFLRHVREDVAGEVVRRHPAVRILQQGRMVRGGAAGAPERGSTGVEEAYDP
jgi:hypothetical protein